MNTSNFTYLVTFNAVSSKFIAQPADLGKLIKTHSKYGIANIKVLDNEKAKFVRISKERLIASCDWFTETIEELKRVKYI